MTRSQSLQAQLAADPAITAILGSGAAIRLYPLMAPTPNGQSTLIYEIKVKYVEFTLDGPGIVEMDLTLSSFATDYDVAHALADAAQANLMPPGAPRGFNGPLGGAGGINVLECHIESETERFVPATFDVGMFQVTSQYRLTYQF